MNKNIYPCIWFNDKGSEAGKYYAETFDGAKVTHDGGMVVTWEAAGCQFMHLDAGPNFKPNFSISFMVMCDTAEELDRYWARLSDGAKVMMELGTYPWSEKYGWLEDQFGVSWQLYLGAGAPQKYVPTLMFTGANNGKCMEAMEYYTEVFPNSKIDGAMKYEEGGDDTPGNVAHAQFYINDYMLMAMDSSADHGVQFDEGISLVVMTNDQEETDYYWNTFTKEGEESMCGWLKDRYGISWQITPHRLLQLMSDPDREKSGRVMQAMLKMKKIIIADLEAAYAAD